MVKFSGIPSSPTHTHTHTHTTCTHIYTQHNGAGVLKLRAQTPQIWHRIWHLTLKLSTTLLSSLGHQCVPHSLDFTAVYQERMNKVRKPSYLTDSTSLNHCGNPSAHISSKRAAMTRTQLILGQICKTHILSSDVTGND